MAFRPRNWLQDNLRRRARSHWAYLGTSIADMGAVRLRNLRDEAFVLRRDLDKFLLNSSRRASAPLADISALQLPAGTDWRWRPELLAARVSPTGIAAPEPGTRLGEAATVWHDCAEHALTLRQVQNVQATDLATFGLRMEVMGFSGSFLSLALDLPDEALHGLTRNHILRLDAAIQIERDMEVYARMNIGNGPNTEELLHHLDEIPAGAVKTFVVEFDLAMTEMNEQRLEKIWLDLIFEKPLMNAVMIREMVLSRRPRANL